ncbi:unnamed protein product [Rhizoctonia solani]|uniref:Uncharacterized protein n=1 Tax=Rhizoctonia solani TaxID=456999 RepID=A0A8H3HTX4_9AGAM|nr:unnamed protein product [Rhizoctonia solani]
MNDTVGLALGPGISYSAPASHPLASSANSSTQGYTVDRIQSPIVLDFYSDRGKEEIKTWYHKQPTTRFTRIEYRRDADGHFKHEFIVACLDNSTVCRFDRRAREFTRGYALKDKGTAPEDITHVITLADTESKARLDASKVLMSMDFRQQQDLEFILAICCGIQLHPRAKSYSLLEYNCYFFSWTLFITINRREFEWQLAPQSNKAWGETVKKLVGAIDGQNIIVRPNRVPFTSKSTRFGRLFPRPRVAFSQNNSRSEIRPDTYSSIKRALKEYTPSILSGGTLDLECLLFRSHFTPMLAKEICSVIQMTIQSGEREDMQMTREDSNSINRPNLTFDSTPDTSTTLRPLSRQKAERSLMKINNELVACIIPYVAEAINSASDFLQIHGMGSEEYVRLGMSIKKRMLNHFARVEGHGFGYAVHLIEEAEESMTEIWTFAQHLMKNESRLSFL